MTFKSHRSYYKFMNAVSSKNRYILDAESQSFMNSILETCQDRIKVVEPSHVLWRAQLGHNEREITQTDHDTGEEVVVDSMPIPFPYQRMKPLVDSASEGRANPKGIPYIYVATDKETAMSEVRPWLGSIISLARFRVNRKLRVIDFSELYGEGNRRFYLGEPQQEEIIKAVWADIDNAFSRPVKASDVTSDYVPTQIISEFIKSKGYDGIAYKSSLAAGHNIALFDLTSADVIACDLHEVSSVKFSFNNMPEHW